MMSLRQGLEFRGASYKHMNLEPKTPLLNYRYISPKAKMFDNDKRVISNKNSIWWRDLILINDCKGFRGVKDALYSLQRLNILSNIRMFGWRLMLNRFPTRDQLWNRGIIENGRDTCCVVFFIEVKVPIICLILVMLLEEFET